MPVHVFQPLDSPTEYRKALTDSRRLSSYSELDYEVNFWRTKTGLEVDFILGRGEVAVEVKGASHIHSPDLRPLKAFMQEYHPPSAYLVCNEPNHRIHEDIHIVPWRDFLKMLWDGGILT